jgi:YbbR domain-containing protein
MNRVRDRLLGLFTRNVWWKLAALALAMLLWIATVGQQELVTTHTVPILYKGLAPDLLIGVEAVDQVRVELRGPASKLQPSNLTELAIVIDLSGSSGGATPTFTLSGTDLHLPTGVTFIRAVPSQLRVPIARKVSKDVPVQIQIGAPPPAGYHVAAMDASPAVVRIAGPEPRVVPIVYAQTDAIDLSHSTSATEVHINVFVADPRVGLESESVVTVRFDIAKDKTTQ